MVIFLCFFTCFKATKRISISITVRLTCCQSEIITLAIEWWHDMTSSQVEELHKKNLTASSQLFFLLKKIPVHENSSHSFISSFKQLTIPRIFPFEKKYKIKAKSITIYFLLCFSKNCSTFSLSQNMKSKSNVQLLLL